MAFMKQSLLFMSMAVVCSDATVCVSESHWSQSTTCQGEPQYEEAEICFDTTEGTKMCGTYGGQILLSCENGKAIMKHETCEGEGCQKCTPTMTATFDPSEFDKIGTGECYSMANRHASDTQGIEITQVSSKMTGSKFSNPCGETDSPPAATASSSAAVIYVPFRSFAAFLPLALCC
eukprot:gnl/TRDRNA2_/TRDRNA2_78984_c0_seq1.p1 gnl/TRDRNA2_/TRDRNA2_78984_c0~~gnl/TRDRNA2_/TRDRNA2_78984_c0_seq1.p1  ORF type:complete len:177 (-),score=19.93 gnl/TRDRNA2_/TRDRNA2_78984_c0_seq1:426-956(-)